MKVPSLKKVLKLGNNNNNKNLLVLIGAGAIIGGAAWWYSNKKKEEADDDSPAPARMQGTGIPPFTYQGRPAHLSFAAGEYPIPGKTIPDWGKADYPGASDSHPFLMENAPLGSPSHPFGYMYRGPTAKGTRSFRDFTFNDNSIPVPFLEVNFPHNPYTPNATKVPPPLANTIDKNAYVVTYTGWRD